MIARLDSSSYGGDGYHRDTHYLGDDHVLHVVSNPQARGDESTHEVRLWSRHGRHNWVGPEFAATPTSATITEVTPFSTRSTTRQIHTVSPPSRDLLTLIERHHEDPTNSWYALLDKLVEEYPDHFDAAVSAHTAARQSNAAEQYARAFAATQRQ